MGHVLSACSHERSTGSNHRPLRVPFPRPTLFVPVAGVYVPCRCLDVLGMTFPQLDLLPGEAGGGEAPADGGGFGESLAGAAGAAAEGEGEEAAGGGDDDAGVQERRRRCLEWCLDHGFEYVEADCRDSERGTCLPLVYRRRVPVGRLP